MKKNLAKIICIILAAALLCGCSSKTEDAPAKSADSAAQDVSEQADAEAEPDIAKKPEKKNAGEAPELLFHRYSTYEWGDGNTPLIKHDFTFVTLDKDQAGRYKGISDGLVDAMNEIIKKEQEVWDDEKEALKERDYFNFEDSWNTFVRRADGTALSVLNEYCEEGQFDSGYYCEFTAHSFDTATGKELAFSDVVKDEDKFFDIIAPKMMEYIEHTAETVYAVEIEKDTWALKSDLKDYLKDGTCAWTIDPQGVTLWLQSYVELQSAVSATVLFSEDKDGKIFNEDYVTAADSEWITQVPAYVDSYYDLDDSGKEEYVGVSASYDIDDSAEEESYCINGLYVSYDGDGQTFTTVKPGGTSFYDSFLMHKDHQTVLLECHDEYDSFLMNTFTLNDDGINMIDSVTAGFEQSDDDTYRYLDTYMPYYFPTDMSKIRIFAVTANGDETDTASVDENGKITAQKLDIHGDINGDAGIVQTGEQEADEPFFGLWTGSFSDRQDALNLVEKLEGKGFEAYCIYTPEWENLSSDPYWSVTIGRSGSEPEAQAYIEDAKAAGYKDAYVKYTGDRLSHRLYCYVYSTGDVKITDSKVTLNDVPTELLSGNSEDEGPMTLTVDASTVFDSSCEMEFFHGYKKGETPLEWYNHAEGTDIMGVFDVGVTGNHIDSIYGSYWWD
ncbi:MAG: SPOR domain-containing protein [Lachnospiraceae bacterium]|nr:SPOR domain-containing protein [Lachnospiraceae bacterium]